MKSVIKYCLVSLFLMAKLAKAMYISRTSFARQVHSWDNIITTANMMWKITDMDSLSHCLVRCLDDRRCISFFFSKEKTTCQGHSAVFSEPNGTRAELIGSRYYFLFTGGCSDTTDYNYQQLANFCYKLPLKKMKWLEAKQVCSSMNAHLISIRSSEEQDYYVSILKILTGQSVFSFAIGVNDFDHTRNWVFWNGQPVEFTNWEQGQPNNENDHSVAISSTTKFWNDIDKNFKVFYLCTSNP